MLTATGSRGTTSPLYSMVLDTPKTDRTTMVTRWQAITGSVISEDQFNTHWRDLNKSVRSMIGREAHYKIFLDWYQYPSKIHKAFLGASPLCWRGCEMIGDPKHI